jgi:YidC/Oxa1 family membrane protein insertase
MRDMQKLKEPLEELKEKYRDDPQKLNKATMRLYKEHGVNPLSGCIVWLPQIPIFWAFFAVLREVIELRGAGFALWINDLSVPDTLATLPIITENGIPIRILPLLMGAAMFFQQRLTGTPGADPRQSKIMGFMPIIFTFFFYGFPSGLVLYWLWNNVLTIAQQYMISKKGNDEEVKLQTKKDNKKKDDSDIRKLPGVKVSGRKRKKKR